jgi:uncharacterized membrane protein YkoI
MKRRTKLIIAGGAVAVAALGGATAAYGGSATDDDGDNETETPITGPDLARAEEAALAYTGGGEVTDTEVGDEESYYEVEVRLPDGRQVDVQLDERFRVVGTDGDDPSGDD